MDRRMVGQMDGRLDGCTVVRTDGQWDQRTDSWTDGQMEIRTDENAPPIDSDERTHIYNYMDSFVESCRFSLTN